MPPSPDDTDVADAAPPADAPPPAASAGARSETRRDIGLRLTILARLLRHSFDREMSALNVTRSQWGMIAVVARHPGATQRMIAESLEMSEASAGRLIDRLCADGLLERRDRDDDRRARAIHLTPAAEPLLEKLAALASVSEQRLFKGFSDKDVAQLQRFLDRLYANASLQA